MKSKELTEVEAFDLTGIKPKPNALVSLRRDWRKASAKERRQFIAEVGPDLDGVRRTPEDQILAAWNRCSPNDRTGFLYTLMKSDGGRSAVKKILAKAEASS